MQFKQRGITFIGWLVLLIPVAIVFYAGLRLTPAYLNYLKVARTMDQVAEEMKGDSSVSQQAIRVSLEKHLNIQSVDFPKIGDFEIRRDGQTWIIESKYEDTAPLFSNISILLTFDKTVEIG